MPLGVCRLTKARSFQSRDALHASATFSFSTATSYFCLNLGVFSVVNHHHHLITRFSLSPYTKNTVAQAIHDLVEAERQKKLLKWFAIITASLLLLTIAATVGLTYAVVVLSKDVNSQSTVFVEKSSGDPMVTGTPAIALVYDPTEASQLAQMFNNTAVTDFNGAGSRRLLGAADNCPILPVVSAVAYADFSYVQNRCAAINKASKRSSANPTFTLKVARKDPSGDCYAVNSRTNGCSTFTDTVTVTDDRCYLISSPTPLTCSVDGQSYSASLVWMDSARQSSTSYLLSCIGTCIDGKVQWGNACGLMKSQCPPGAVGRRRSLLGEGEVSMETYHGLEDDFGVKMNCESGRCFATTL